MPESAPIEVGRLPGRAGGRAEFVSRFRDLSFGLSLILLLAIGGAVFGMVFAHVQFESACFLVGLVMMATTPVLLTIWVFSYLLRFMGFSGNLSLFSRLNEIQAKVSVEKPATGGPAMKTGRAFECLHDYALVIGMAAIGGLSGFVGVIRITGNICLSLFATIVTAIALPFFWLALMRMSSSATQILPSLGTDIRKPLTKTLLLFLVGLVSLIALLLCMLEYRGR